MVNMSEPMIINMIQIKMISSIIARGRNIKLMIIDNLYENNEGLFCIKQSADM
jgi:hypothetical protein